MQAVVFVGLLALGVAAGTSAILQQVLVAQLKASLGSASWAVLVSYVGGTLTMIAVLIATRETMIGSAAFAKPSWLAWMGGVFGVIYIVIAILLIPKLGAATTVAVLIAGQLLASMVFDHFGLFGVPQQPFDAYRAAGALMLLGGVVLVRS